LRLQSSAGSATTTIAIVSSRTGETPIRKSTIDVAAR
jgi:hypothetical protein